MGHDEHGHEHEHEHGHEHEHEHEDVQGHRHGNERRLLGQGEGKGKLLFFDAFSGVAGDMTVAAFVDLGVPLAVIENALAKLPVSGFHLHVGHVHRSAVVATTFDVHVEGSQPERTYGAIDQMLLESPLSDSIKNIARRIFRKLGEAEANVHKMDLADVHFHEVGGVDAIVDIVGAATGFDWLGATVVASPLPMSHGFVSAMHGTLPLPAPAVVECLTGVPTYGVDLDKELVTPTGAAIVATMASKFERWPAFSPERVGWGGGRRELPDRPNLLRLVLGAPESISAPASGSHVVVEANVDDMNGELAGHALAMLLASGALDAWATPVVMKKGRPGLTLSALARAEEADVVAASVLRETSSIGVRVVSVGRVERPRRIVEVSTPFGPIPVKVSTGPYGPPLLKPEFDACARAAAASGVTVREVLTAALTAARDLA
jgi:uncharacterized protein (TIGR00299 family) protein